MDSQEQIARIERYLLDVPDDWCKCKIRCKNWMEHRQRMQDIRYEIAEQEIDRKIEQEHGLEQNGFLPPLRMYLLFII